MKLVFEVKRLRGITNFKSVTFETNYFDRKNTTLNVTLFSAKSGRYLKFHRITNTHDTHLLSKSVVNDFPN